MLDSKGFNRWASQYDDAVIRSENENSYPFAGYSKILGTIAERILNEKRKDVLDLGFGTAVLTSYLYENGCCISGMDFSDEMVRIAQSKMPEANLFKGDFKDGIPEALKTKKYDAAVCTYAIHHLNDDEKIVFINEILSVLKDDGILMIGDVAFQSKDDLLKCIKQNEEIWDDDEIYCVIENIRPYFEHIDFKQMTFCSGIIFIRK